MTCALQCEGPNTRYCTIQKISLWDFMDGMKLSPWLDLFGQFNCFFFQAFSSFLLFFPNFFFLLGLLFYFIFPTTFYSSFFQGPPMYLHTTFPHTTYPIANPFTSFMLLTLPPPLVLYSPPSPITSTFGFRIYL